jgi:hypothetical protein
VAPASLLFIGNRAREMCEPAHPRVPSSTATTATIVIIISSLLLQNGILPLFQMLCQTYLPFVCKYFEISSFISESCQGSFCPLSSAFFFKSCCSARVSSVVFLTVRKDGAEFLLKRRISTEVRFLSSVFVMVHCH